MFDTPILFLIFNRPEVTKITFERLKELKPYKLYVAADGPRAHKANEIELCEQTRAIIKNIDWKCELKTLFREQNIGCGKAVSEAITWFFNEEEAGIIMEDDILPDISFFNYCAYMLNYYKNDETVMHIGGSNYLYQHKTKYSYIFSPIPFIWGWATWKRAWRKYDFSMKDFYLFAREETIYQYYPDKKLAEYWLNNFRQMYYNQIDTWDYQWVFCIYINNGMAIIPSVNLVSNIGFGSDATHTFDSGSIFSKHKTYQLSDTIVHPEKKQMDTESAFLFYKKVEQLPEVNKPKINFRVRLINKLYNLKLKLFK
jgi:hypothetical protein